MSETRNHFLHDLFDELGVPTSHRTAAARACVAWWQAEGGATTCEPHCGEETDWNPLNTTRREPGSHDQPGNSVPVQVYADRASGLKATADTLRQSNMETILHRLLTPGYGSRSICRAVVASDWGTTAQPMMAVLDEIINGRYSVYASIRVYPS